MESPVFSSWNVIADARNSLSYFFFYSVSLLSMLNSLVKMFVKSDNSQLGQVPQIPCRPFFSQPFASTTFYKDHTSLRQTFSDCSYHLGKS